MNPSPPPPPGSDPVSDGCAARSFDFDGDYGADYEALAHRVIPGYATLFPMVAALLDPELPPEARVLVIGAGTGIEMVTLGSARPDLRLHGIDPSRQMLEIARQRLDEQELTDRTILQLGYAADAPAHPLFDAATLINVLHFVPDDGSKAALLGEIGNRLKPGGIFVLFDLHGDPADANHRRSMAAWERYWALRGMRSDDTDAFRARIASGIHFAPAERLVALARAAGFGESMQFFRSLLYGGWIFRRTDSTPAENGPAPTPRNA